jgi:protein tyrosine/serine phosphatase
LTHIRDNPEIPFLFHCSAGKDRTGVISAIILHIAGSQKEDIAFDYALSRLGVEPAREVMTKILTRDLGLDVDTPGVKEMCSIRWA